MKTILLLTDFSENAEHAGDAALMLCVKLSAQLLLFHAYPTIPAMAYYASGPRYGEDAGWWQRESDQNLDSLRNRLRNRCHDLGIEEPTIRFESHEGNLESCLNYPQKQH